MPERKIKVVSNNPGVAQVASRFRNLEVIIVDTPIQLFRLCRSADLIVLDGDHRMHFVACLVRPFSRFRLVSLDLILRRPQHLKSWVACYVKRVLLAQVDQFILYFRELSGYRRFYGIDAARTKYLPFKVNGWENRAAWPVGNTEGDYVLCAGRTMRDVSTFVAAMRKVGYPGILLQQSERLLKEHGTAPWIDSLPANVRIVDPGDGLDRFIAFMSAARLVIIPRFRHDIASTGISTYLTAMALGKCVILSRGPGAEDVLLDEEAMLVPPENCDELADAISHLWTNARAREQIAARGMRYAHALAGEERLCTDVLRESLLCLSSGPGNKVIPPASPGRLAMH